MMTTLVLPWCLLFFLAWLSTRVVRWLERKNRMSHTAAVQVGFIAGQLYMLILSWCEKYL